jgi:ADP-heptose:LPS heptosyltransferase
MSPHCLVIHPGALGDVLLAGPALVHLGRLGFRTTLAVTSRLVALFAGSGLVGSARDVEGLELQRLFVEAGGSGTLGAAGACDAIVSWFGAGDPTFRASLVRSGCPAVIARAAPPPGAGRHVARHLLETLAPLGPLPPSLPEARLGVRPVDRSWAESWLGARGIEPAKAVVLQPGAGGADKMWPGFAALARRLRETGFPVVALAGPADRSAVEALLAEGALGEDAVARDWPLPRVAALLALARAAVGNDSGPTHLAAAVGCPTVAVFGPTDPAVWAPVGPRVRVVAGSAGARPWTEVGVARVEAALRALLTGGEAPSRSGTAPVGVGPAWP